MTQLYPGVDVATQCPQPARQLNDPVEKLPFTEHLTILDELLVPQPCSEVGRVCAQRLIEGVARHALVPLEAYVGVDVRLASEEEDRVCLRPDGPVGRRSALLSGGPQQGTVAGR